MINLLFITNNPRAEQLCGHFQQQLKVRIDLVSDFDHGLKGVFEQRPSVVCIQEQIAGVTGESVARHIQMLLGSDAPAFILLHEGSSRAKPVPRLFEHLVDLSAPFEAVSTNLCQALKKVLAEHWELVCPVTSPPMMLEARVLSEPVTDSPDFAATSHPASEQLRDGQTVDDFEDLFERPAVGGPLTETAFSFSTDRQPSEQLTSTLPAASTNMAGGEEIRTAALQSAQPPPKPVPAEHQGEDEHVVPDETEQVASESVPVEALLQAVEDRYIRRKRLLWGSLAGVLLLVASVAVWWFVKPHHLLNHRPAVTAAPAPAPQIQTQKPLSSPASVPMPAAQEPLPSFVSAAKADPAFAATKPGWSRYLSQHRDYRLYYQQNRLRAVQVLVIGNQPISVDELKRVVKELSGSDQYQVKKKKHSQGVWVEEATGQDDIGLLIYRTGTRGPITAFVLARTP